MSNSSQLVLAVGATGPVAGLVPGALARRGIKVRALVRSLAKAEVLRQQGVEEIAVGDLRDPDSLERAATGVDGVFHIGPAFLADEAQLGLNMVTAAQRAGVGRFVFSSVIQPTASRLSNHASKIPVEDALYASGMEYVVLQPANFFQNIGQAWNSVVRTGVFSEPFSRNARIGRVDYRDVAEVIGIAFAEDRLTYGTFELCAGLMNREEIVAVMSHALRTRIEAGEPAFNEWAAAAGAPVGEEQRQGMKNVFDYYGHSPLGGNSLVLQTILRREPTSLREYIETLKHTEQVPRIFNVRLQSSGRAEAEHGFSVRSEVAKEGMGTAGKADQGVGLVTTQGHNGQGPNLFAAARDYLKTAYAVRHLLVATTVFLLAIVILLFLR
jgi:uncharacterized protein YbjT (DUF2867 family)